MTPFSPDATTDGKTSPSVPDLPADVARQFVVPEPESHVSEIRRARNGRQSALGPMSSRSAQLPHFIAERTQFDLPTRIANGNSTGSYSQAAAWSAAHRPGSRDFLSAPSLIGGQLVHRKEQQ